MHQLGQFVTWRFTNCRLCEELCVTTVTKSEDNTIRYFESYNIKIEKIPVSLYLKTKTPDFVISHNDQTINIEVKEITENPEEVTIRKRVENGEQVSYDSSPVVKRIREKIREANGQLKKRCKNDQPGILIIQDIRPFITQSIGLSEFIKQAMFGDRVIWRTVPNHRNNYTTETSADVFDKNKKIRRDINTIISAVAMLVSNSETKNIAMYLFHNPYAENKLKQGLIKGELFHEYKILSTTGYGEFIEL